MKTSFRFEGLPSEVFEPLFTKSDEELDALCAKRIIVDQSPGYPCRVSLQDATEGETILLIPFAHLDRRSGYRSMGPIFVRQGSLQARLSIGEIPQVFKNRLLSVRSYDLKASMIGADVVACEDLASTLGNMFSDSEVEFVDVHNAKPGCFAARALRA